MNLLIAGGESSLRHQVLSKPRQSSRPLSLRRPHLRDARHRKKHFRRFVRKTGASVARFRFCDRGLTVQPTELRPLKSQSPLCQQ